MLYLCAQETRRRQLAEAAEQRQKANEGRGVKDPEALKRKQQRKEEMERKAEMQQHGDGGPGLKVSTFQQKTATTKTEFMHAHTYTRLNILQAGLLIK